MAISLFELNDPPDNRNGVARASGGLSAPPPPGDALASPRLEDYNNKRKYNHTGRVFVKPCNCRCRTCQDCGPRYGLAVRYRLLDRAMDFRKPAMFTLTVDRKAFSSPLDAFTQITKEGYIRRLMRLLGVELWAWTLEFQMQTGEGWPHWHMVIDLPIGKLDLERAWRLWRDKWKLGGLDLQRKSSKSARHALMYVTKYLTKYPEEGFPTWVLNLDRRIRWVGASRLVGPLVSDREMTTKDAGDDEEAKKSLPRVHRPLAVRMADCGQIINFFAETEYDGEVYQSFYGRLPREQLEAAIAGESKMDIFHDEEGYPFLQGNWADFEELADQVMEAANMYPNKCKHEWFTHGRLRKYKQVARNEHIQREEG